MKKVDFKKNSILLLALFTSFTVCSQSLPENLRLASEYMMKGDSSKALAVYQTLAKEQKNHSEIYTPYKNLLIANGTYKEAEAFIQKLIKANPEFLTYQVDNISLLKVQNKTKEYQKEYSNISESVKYIPERTITACELFLMLKLNEEAYNLYTESRKALKDNLLYGKEVADLFYLKGNIEAMVEEYIKLLEYGRMQQQEIKNELQIKILEQNRTEVLENILIAKLQKYPNSYDFADLAIWFYVQQLDFNSAFIQAKAVDKRFAKNGRILFSLATLAYENEAYKETENICRYIIDNQNKDGLYPQAKKLLLSAKLKVLLSDIPPDRALLANLVQEHKNFILETGEHINVPEQKLELARIYAYHLSYLDSATIMYEEIVSWPRLPDKMVAEAKIELADVYLLLGKFWDASLLYSQAEKLQKDQPIGYEAKYRNARLLYFKGEFELAQGHLDILKLATTREISNNAIDLSLLIKNNTIQDTTDDALRTYASADLQHFMKNIVETERILNEFLIIYPNHSLTDEVYYKQAEIYRNTNRPDNAVMTLKKLLKDYGNDVLADKATYLLANIYESDLGQKDNAISAYQEILKKHPASTFVLEARKRIRKLQGGLP